MIDVELVGLVESEYNHNQTKITDDHSAYVRTKFNIYILETYKYFVSKIFKLT